MRVPWTATRSNQSILKEITPEYSLEGLMLKLKPQYFGHLMRRADSLEKTLMLGKIELGPGFQHSSFTCAAWAVNWVQGLDAQLSWLGSQHLTPDVTSSWLGLNCSY